MKLALNLAFLLGALTLDSCCLLQSAAFVAQPAHFTGVSQGHASGACRRLMPFRTLSLPLRANLNRQHDFGIDQNKVHAVFDRLEALDVDMSKDIEEKFIRGSGAGGQKINKTSSNVQLIHHPTGLVVCCQRERMREKNRFLALRDLVDQLEALKGGGPTKSDLAAEKIKKQKARRRRKSTKKHAQGEAEAEDEDDLDLPENLQQSTSGIDPQEHPAASNKKNEAKKKEKTLLDDMYGDDGGAD